LGESKIAYVDEVRAEYRKVAEGHARGMAEKRRITLQKARDDRFPIDWSGYRPPRPSFLGTRIFRNYPVAELVPYIDWTPFFATWEIKGTYPLLFDDEKVGAAARALFDDATA